LNFPLLGVLIKKKEKEIMKIFFPFFPHKKEALGFQESYYPLSLIFLQLLLS